MGFQVPTATFPSSEEVFNFSSDTKIPTDDSLLQRQSQGFFRGEGRTEIKAGAGQLTSVKAVGAK